jgi:hypothetical protein
MQNEPNTQLKKLINVFQLVSPEILEKHQAKSLKEAQANSKNAFICKTPDCKGW